MCHLCNRASRTTRHHLIPRARRGPTVDLCRDCHRMVHATFDNRRLARELDTVERLQAATELQPYFRQIRRRPASTYYGARGRG